MSLKEKLKTLLQTKFVKKTCMVFSLIAMTSALALVAIACTPESVQDPPSPPITTPSDDSKPSEVTPGDETTDDETTDDETTDPENPDITDPETPTEPEDPGITEPEDPDITEPTDPENPDITDPETPVDPEEPEIEDPTPEISFEDLYNEVFGEGYDLVPFEQYLYRLASLVFDKENDEILIIEFNKNAFVIYGEHDGFTDERGMTRATYRNGAPPAALLDYEALTQEAGGLPLKAYLEIKYSSSSMSAEEIRTELETYKTRTDAIDRLEKFLGAGFKSNFEQRTLIINTRDDIDFSAYAEEYTPDGATPLKCYVGSLSFKTLDNKFGTGYTQQFDAAVIYLNADKTLTVKRIVVFVPWYRNSTDEISYNFALGEENEDYIVYERDTWTYSNPILSEELLANIENTL